MKDFELMSPVITLCNVSSPGGPVFSMVGKTPVLEGVFSFMLWGTCRGRKEPTYYNKVRQNAKATLELAGHDY